MREWKGDVVLPPGAYEALAKEVVYVTKSIMKRRVSAYAFIDGVLHDWAKVWFWDGQIKVFPWTRVKFPNDSSRLALEKNLVSNLVSECQYINVTKEDIDEVSKWSFDLMCNSRNNL